MLFRPQVTCLECSSFVFACDSGLAQDALKTNPTKTPRIVAYCAVHKIPIGANPLPSCCHGKTTMLPEEVFLELGIRIHNPHFLTLNPDPGPPGTAETHTMGFISIGHNLLYQAPHMQLQVISCAPAFPQNLTRKQTRLLSSFLVPNLILSHAAYAFPILSSHFRVVAIGIAGSTFVSVKHMPPSSKDEQGASQKQLPAALLLKHKKALQHHARRKFRCQWKIRTHLFRQRWTYRLSISRIVVS